MTAVALSVALSVVKVFEGRAGRVAGVLPLLALIAAPWLVDAYAISALSQMLIMGVLAMSVSLLAGVAGLPSLAQAAYFGVGAYTAALLGRAGVVVGPVQLAAAAIVAAGCAAVTGTVAVRARGVTFLMLTLAVGELLHATAAQWRTITGGTDGLPGLPSIVPLPGAGPLVRDGMVFYYVLACSVSIFMIIRVLVRSPFGLALRCIRDNEVRMRATGCPVHRFLLAGYALAGAVAGAAGALWVSVTRYVSPADLGFGLAALALLAAVIGGVGSMAGACVGAALVTLVRDRLGDLMPIPFTDSTASGTLLLGLGFIAAIYLLPGGVGSALEKLLRAVRGGGS